jgi:hypothetical protein
MGLSQDARLGVRLRETAEIAEHADNFAEKYLTGDRGAAKERTGTEGGTYMDDPAGYVIQFITDGME